MECRVHKLVADVAPLSAGRVLLVKYRDTSKYDHQKGWFLPDDFLSWEEHPTAAAKRILQEQAGLSSDSVHLASIESFDGGAWHLVFHHVVEFPESVSVTPGENVAAAEWFDLRSLPDPSEMAHQGWGLETLDQVLG